jgi:molecular chaperone DnaK
MKSIIGVDLGVEEVRVARINENGDPELTLNNENLCSTSSAVEFSDEKVIIGNQAREVAGITEHAFAEFLRDIGRGITHKTPHGTFSPSDLCTLLLRPLIEHVRLVYGEASAVTIAIPCNLSGEARLEILRAATLAGIYKPNLINDSTAEALYLRHAHKLKEGKYLLVTLRAGTADATVFEVAGDYLSIVSASGVQQLGSNDLRHSMTGIVSEKISMKVGKKVTRDDLVMDYCVGGYNLDRIIQGLGTRKTFQHIVRSLEFGRIDIEISRKEFDERIASHTKQLEYLIESALDKAGVTPRNLNGCFLSAPEIDRPFWAPRIGTALGIEPFSTPEGSIAMGAALYAASKSRDEDLPLMGHNELKSTKVQDVAPYFVGILEIDWLTQTKRNRIVITKGELLPCKRTFELVADDSGRIPEIVLTTSYVAGDDADQVVVLKTISPTQTTARSKHTLTIMMNENGCTSATLRNDDDDSSRFMEFNT